MGSTYGYSISPPTTTLSRYSVVVGGACIIRGLIVKVIGGLSNN